MGRRRPHPKPGRVTPRKNKGRYLPSVKPPVGGNLGQYAKLTQRVDLSPAGVRRALLSLRKRIRQLPREGLAALDADGTLWSGDVGRGFFRWMITMDAPEKASLSKPLQRAVNGYRRRATPIWNADRRGELASEDYYRRMTLAMGGMWEKHAFDLAEHYFEAHHLKDFFPEMVEIVRWFAARGLKPVVDSGSPYWVVAAGARRLGIGKDEVVGLRLETKGGRLFARLQGPEPWGEGKVDALRYWFPNEPLLAAVGNSVEGDGALLRAAVFLAAPVNPDPMLRAHAQGQRGCHVLHLIPRLARNAAKARRRRRRCTKPSGGDEGEGSKPVVASKRLTSKRRAHRKRVADKP